MTMSLCNHVMQSKNDYLYHKFSILLPKVVAALLVKLFLFESFLYCFLYSYALLNSGSGYYLFLKDQKKKTITIRFQKSKKQKFGCNHNLLAMCIIISYIERKLSTLK